MLGCIEFSESAARANTEPQEKNVMNCGTSVRIRLDTAALLPGKGR